MRAARLGAYVAAAAWIGSPARADGGRPAGLVGVAGHARSATAPDLAGAEIGVEARAATPAAALDGTGAAAGSVEASAEVAARFWAAA